MATLTPPNQEHVHVSFWELVYTGTLVTRAAVWWATVAKNMVPTLLLGQIGLLNLPDTWMTPEKQYVFHV